MTYDAILATRGWGRDEFDTVTPAFRDAVTFGLFAERLAPLLDDIQSAVHAPLPPGANASELAKAMGDKTAAQRAADEFRSILFPEDDDA